MKPAFYRIRDQYRNDTTDLLQFNFINTDTTPIDITGISIKVEFRKGDKRGKVFRTMTNNDGITIISALNGSISFTQYVCIFPSELYYYDIQFTYPNGVIKTLIEGEMKVIQDITK
jgi:hypothetical protein